MEQTPTPSRPDVLDLRNVTKEFRRPGQPPFVAVADLNLTVSDLDRKGEFITVVGPSGCGKSTVLQIVAGFDTHIPVSAGEALFLGRPIQGPGADRGMLFQQYSCFPNRTVLDNITFGLKLQARALGLSGREIAEIGRHWLRRVRLTDADAGKYPHELSGGMRQRVALARALALKPRCLLMDEPFSALDEPTRLEMQDLIVDLWAEVDSTIILVSHSIAEAVFLGDRVWVMSGAPGTIVHEFVDVPQPDPSVPAMVAQSRPSFAEHVARVSDAFFQVLRTPRAELRAIHADGSGRNLPREG